MHAAKDVALSSHKKEMTVEYKNLLVEKNEGVAIVTLNRPAANNTLSVDLMQELETLAEEFQSDLETRAVVFTGAGKNFCLGADVMDPKQLEMSMGPVLKRYRGFSIGPRMRQARSDEIVLQNHLSKNRPAYRVKFADFRPTEILIHQKTNTAS